MKKTLLTCCLFVSLIHAQGQNLVPNGNFEQYSACPTSNGQLNLAVPWINPSTWATPDYYNQCDNSLTVGVPVNFKGYQYAHSGGGYAGIHRIWISGPSANYREYIEAHLTSSLVSNNCYHFEMYINLSNESQLTSADIAVYFSDTIITGFTTGLPLPYIPQLNNTPGNNPDTLSWTLVSGNYNASGGENYMIIGNFKDDTVTTTTLVNTAGQFDESYVFIDDVSLTPCTGIESPTFALSGGEGIIVYPNPVKDWLNVQLSNSSEEVHSDNFQNKKAEIKITDVLGKEIFRRQFSTFHLQIPTSNFQSGVYFIEINDACLPDRQGNAGSFRERRKFIKE